MKASLVLAVLLGFCGAPWARGQEPKPVREREDSSARGSAVQPAGGQEAASTDIGKAARPHSYSQEACSPPSCLVVFGHIYHIGPGSPATSRVTRFKPTDAPVTQMKIVVGPDATRLVPSQGVYERCLPPSCYLSFSHGPLVRPQRIEKSLANRPLTTPGAPFTKVLFFGNDGTPIQPYYDDSGNIIGASGRDANGASRQIGFSTNIDRQFVAFRTPTPFCHGPGSLPHCLPPQSLPPGCDSFGCNVSKTTVTISYSEQADPLLLADPIFNFVIVTDPFNREAQVEVNRSVADPKAAVANPVTALRYVATLDGSGLEHILHLDGTDSTTPFTIDLKQGTMSIASKVDTLFPETARSLYFSQVINYIFVHQPPFSGGQPSFATGGGPNTSNFAQLFGDAVIALAAGAACTASVGIGCALAGAAAAAGIDYWDSLHPGVVDPVTGLTDADQVVNYWYIGICTGLGNILPLFDITPPSCQ